MIMEEESTEDLCIYDQLAEAFLKDTRRVIRIPRDVLNRIEETQKNDELYIGSGLEGAARRKTGRGCLAELYLLKKYWLEYSFVATEMSYRDSDTLYQWDCYIVNDERQATLFALDWMH